MVLSICSYGQPKKFQVSLDSVQISNINQTRVFADSCAYIVEALESAVGAIKTANNDLLTINNTLRENLAAQKVLTKGEEAKSKSQKEAHEKQLEECEAEKKKEKRKSLGKGFMWGAIIGIVAETAAILIIVLK